MRTSARIWSPRLTFDHNPTHQIIHSVCAFRKPAFRKKAGGTAAKAGAGGAGGGGGARKRQRKADSSDESGGEGSSEEDESVLLLKSKQQQAKQPRSVFTCIIHHTPMAWHVICIATT